jgi:cation-transporting ATPase 13A3/4/5
MATGDNILTAISVAKECNMVDKENDVFVGDLRKSKDGTDKLYWVSYNNKH